MRIESLILITVLTIIFLFINYNLVLDRSKREKIQKDILFKYSLDKHKEIRDKLVALEYPELGVSGSQVLTEITEIIEEQINDPQDEQTEDDTTTPQDESEKPDCIISPVNGSCPSGTIMNTIGCCDLPESQRPSKLERGLSIAQSIVLSMVLEELAMMILLRLPRVLARIGRSLIDDGARFIARAAAILGRRSARTAARIGLTTAAKRASSTVARTAAKGPSGLATLPYELVGAFFDIADMSGYDTHPAQSAFEKMRNLIDFQLQKNAQQPEDGSEPSTWPILMPIGLLYETEFNEAYEEIISEYFTAAITKILEDESSEFGDDVLASLLIFSFNSENEFNTGNYEIPDEHLEVISDEAMKLMNGDPSLSTDENNKRLAARDLLLLNTLTSKISDPGNVELYPELSSSTQIGVSFSRKALDQWNEDNYENYLKQNPTNMPIVTKIAGYHGKTYRVLDVQNPGTSDNPNMITKELQNPAPLCGIYGVLAYLCAGDKSTQGLFEVSANPTIFPSKKGVRYDFENMRCIFTVEYCESMGLRYDPNDNQCKMRPGQKEAEFIFGPTLVRGPIESWTTVSNFIDANTPFNGEVTTGFLLAAAAVTGIGAVAAAAFILAPSIVNAVETISGNFKDKKPPDQIENTEIANRVTKNTELRTTNYSFLYEHDATKFFISEAIDFSA